MSEADQTRINGNITKSHLSNNSELKKKSRLAQVFQELFFTDLKKNYNYNQR